MLTLYKLGGSTIDRKRSPFSPHLIHHVPRLILHHRCSRSLLQLHRLTDQIVRWLCGGAVVLVAGRNESHMSCLIPLSRSKVDSRGLTLESDTKAGRCRIRKMFHRCKMFFRSRIYCKERRQLGVQKLGPLQTMLPTFLKVPPSSWGICW